MEPMGRITEDVQMALPYQLDVRQLQSLAEFVRMRYQGGGICYLRLPIVGDMR